AIIEGLGIAEGFGASEPSVVALCAVALSAELLSSAAFCCSVSSGSAGDSEAFGASAGSEGVSGTCGSGFGVAEGTGPGVGLGVGFGVALGVAPGLGPGVGCGVGASTSCSASEASSSVSRFGVEEKAASTSDGSSH